MRILQTLILSLLSTVLLVPAAALAHTGHFIDSSTHSFLHSEHLIMIAVIGCIVYVMTVVRNK